MLSTIIRERTSSVSPSHENHLKWAIPSHENHLKWALPSCETCEKRQGAISSGNYTEAMREEKAAYQRFRWHHRHESRVAAQTQRSCRSCRGRRRTAACGSIKGRTSGSSTPHMRTPPCPWFSAAPLSAPRTVCAPTRRPVPPRGNMEPLAPRLWRTKASPYP